MSVAVVGKKRLSSPSH